MSLVLGNGVVNNWNKPKVSFKSGLRDCKDEFQGLTQNPGAFELL